MSTKQVIRFAKVHNYLLSVDEQTVESALYATYIKKAMDGNYDLILALIEHEMTYKIEKKKDSVQN